ncbi:MAG: hypothetical protein ABIF09_18685 [Gemmatimonadota bacterium]
MNLLTTTVRTARLGDEIIVPWTTGTLESGVSAYHMALLQADLAALDPRTGTVRNVVALGEVLDDPSAGFVATDGGFPLWYRLWAVCGDQIRAYDRARNQLRGFTGSGQKIPPIDLDFGGLQGGPTWLRISSDGEIRKVRLPERFDAFRFTTDRLWGVQRDELDLSSVAWIELPLD